MSLTAIINGLYRLARDGARVLANFPASRAQPSAPNQVNRLEALERAAEVQAALNDSVTFQLKVVCDLLEKSRNRLFVVTLGLIATATVAAVALAAAMLS
jgi:hypothetical protein